MDSEDRRYDKWKQIKPTPPLYKVLGISNEKMAEIMEKAYELTYVDFDHWPGWVD